MASNDDVKAVMGCIILSFILLSLVALAGAVVMIWRYAIG